MNCGPQSHLYFNLRPAEYYLLPIRLLNGFENPLLRQSSDESSMSVLLLELLMTSFSHLYSSQFHQRLTYKFFVRMYVLAAFTTYMELEKSYRNEVFMKSARVLC